MADARKLNRRSFLARICGAATLGAATLGGGMAARAQPTDIDANDSPGRRIPFNSVTDHDHNDQAGHGRGIFTGHTDHDGSDPSQHGRNMPNTDRDLADRAGRGRNFPVTPPATTPPPPNGAGN